MKQHMFIDAYKVLQKFENKELPLDISFKFFKLKQMLTDQWNFQLERETLIFDKYHPKREDNQLVFESSEEQNKFAEELSELANMDVDTSIEKLEINFGDKLELSVADIEALDAFVKF